MNKDIETIQFDEKGLIPCICQDFDTKEVLMLGYMNKESIEQTLNKKRAVYFSRSRQELWEKGASSGNVQELKSFAYDCDQDTLLIQVKQTGHACHTGAMSCFFNKVYGEEQGNHSATIKNLYHTILDRKENPVEGSYTNYLFDKGIDKILKKVGEESAETIIAAKNNSREELIYEASDLVYHLLVLLANQGVTVEDITDELEKR